MRFAYPMQQMQDWLTQQWVIFRGRRIDPKEYSWLIGPFGNLDIIGENFLHQFASKEKLVIERNATSKGLIPSMMRLNLQEHDFLRLSESVIHFYEHTSDYHLNFSVKWNPVFKVFGILLNKLFSNRINQLNIPTQNISDQESLKSEIINLVDPVSGAVKYTFWLRSIQSSGQVIYSGVYGVCTLPSGQTCVKAVFPLPNGNATVLMTPSVTADGRLVLDSSGRKFGDAGFYFLLKDSKGDYWSQFIRSFRDQLIVTRKGNHITAEQTLTLWHQKVLTFNYEISRKE